MSEPKLSIHLGVLARPIKDQLESQGIKMPTKLTRHWQRSSTSISLLKISGLLTEGESEKSRGRLVKRIADAVRGRHR